MAVSWGGSSPDHTLNNPVDKITDRERLAWRHDQCSKGMLQENISNLSFFIRRLERLAGILKFQELLKLHPIPVKVVLNENGFHITDCVWSTEKLH
ncbi:hypothetical protein TNCV_4764031 [Trichonephila clavipes]|nr:hypothetical protein TNCV_4764031 [Trichonephila clavipes]